MKLVIETKSVKYMPLPMTLMTFLCSLLWTVYALYISQYLAFDVYIYILIPNVAGSILGLLQICLYARFYGMPDEEMQLLRNEDATMLLGDALEEQLTSSHSLPSPVQHL